MMLSSADPTAFDAYALMALAVDCGDGGWRPLFGLALAHRPFPRVLETGINEEQAARLPADRVHWFSSAATVLIETNWL